MREPEKKKHVERWVCLSERFSGGDKTVKYLMTNALMLKGLSRLAS
jgi:hypothetical protein